MEQQTNELVRNLGAGRWLGIVAWPTGFVLATTLLVLLARATISWEKPCPDFTCYWSAGTILVAGQCPYNFELQAKVQHEYGWDKERDGLGFYDFLPYRYPPSVLHLVCMSLVPLGFPTARLTWLVINSELLFVTGYMLSKVLTGVARWVPIVVVPSFAFSVLAVLVGQVSPLILFLVVAIWRLLEARWDRCSGWCLAWMTIKPQLTILFLVATLLWSIRQRRCQVMAGFAWGCVVLLLASCWMGPTWPHQMLRSSSENSLVTVQYPWVGTTWPLMLRTLGVEGSAFWVAYLAVALGLASYVLRMAWDRHCPLSDLTALSTLAAFFIAPYARNYDMVVLVIPLLVLIQGRLHQVWSSVLLFTFVVLPYAQFVYLGGPDPRFPWNIWCFWIPLLLAMAWVKSRPIPRDRPR